MSDQQPRLAPITPGSRQELAALENTIKASRGRVSALYQVLLNSPPIASGWEQMLSAVRNQNSLPASLRELVILRVAVLNRAPYEFDAHVPHALLAGVSQEKVDATKNSFLSDLFSPDELIALRLTDQMTREIEVPDAMFSQIQQRFQGQELLDLCVTIAAYNMVSRLLVALHIGH